MATPAIWFRLGTGEWNGDPSADPATQTGGFDISSIAPPYLPFVNGNTGFASNITTTLNAGGSPFVNTPPAGSTPLGASITWNPADIHEMNLSGGNLTTSLGQEDFGYTRATGGASGGNLQYFELTNAANYQNVALGVANPSADLSSLGVGAVWYNGADGTPDTNGSIVINGTDILVTGLDEPIGVVGVAIFTVGSPTPTPTPVVPGPIIPQSLGLWRGQCGINWQGLALVGDAFTNVVGLSDFTIFNEYGNQMLLLATAPPIHDDRKRISIPRFEIEVEAGLGTPGAPEVAPLMMMDYSKDGGVTWVNLQVFRSMGAVGEYIKRLRWINLGNSRTWVFRLQYSGAARPAIIGTYYDFFKNLG